MDCTSHVAPCFSFLSSIRSHPNQREYPTKSWYNKHDDDATNCWRCRLPSSSASMTCMYWTKHRRMRCQIVLLLSFAHTTHCYMNMCADYVLIDSIADWPQIQKCITESSFDMSSKFVDCIVFVYNTLALEALTLSVAAADLSGQITSMKVSQRGTWNPIPSWCTMQAFKPIIHDG